MVSLVANLKYGIITVCHSCKIKIYIRKETSTLDALFSYVLIIPNFTKIKPATTTVMIVIKIARHLLFLFSHPLK